MIIVPVHQVKQRGKVKNQISVNKAEVKAFGKGRVYSKKQDSWANFVQKHFNRSIKRGKSKEETQREHVHADIYRKEMQKAEIKAMKNWESNSYIAKLSKVNSNKLQEEVKKKVSEVIKLKDKVIRKLQETIDLRDLTIRKKDSELMNLREIVAKQERKISDLDRENQKYRHLEKPGQNGMRMAVNGQKTEIKFTR